MKLRIPKHTTTLLKIVGSIACLWYALTQPDWTQLRLAWDQTNPAWLFVALGSYTFSKVLASRRLNINFRLIGIHLTESVNLRLFWLGMLYNLLLPGAITGDAYKVMVLGRDPATSRKSLALAVLLDRFSGLLPLMVIISGLCLLVLPVTAWTLLILIGSVLIIPATALALRFFLPEQARGFFQTLWLGTLVQLLVVLTVLALIRSMGLHANATAYLLLFLTAAALSVLPISVGGGLGIREFASIQGAQWLNLPLENALLLSLLFYGVTVLTALPGFLYIFRNPLAESK